MRRIEARFRFRRLWKVWRFREQTLREALLNCARYYARLEGRDEPRGVSVAEYDHWRQRELELAQACGDIDFFLPSAGPYRSRYTTWEGALLHFGFTPEQTSARLEPRIDPAARAADAYMPAGLPVAEMAAVIDTSAALPLTVEQALRVRDAYAQLAARSRYVLTVRLGLGTEAWPLRKAAEPLGLHLSRIRRFSSPPSTHSPTPPPGPGAPGRSRMSCATRLWRRSMPCSGSPSPAPVQRRDGRRLHLALANALPGRRLSPEGPTARCPLRPAVLGELLDPVLDRSLAVAVAGVLCHSDALHAVVDMAVEEVNPTPWTIFPGPPN